MEQDENRGKEGLLDKRHQKNTSGNRSGGGAQVNKNGTNSSNNQAQNQQQGQNNKNTLTFNSIMNNGAQLTSGQVLTKPQHVGHYEVGWNANILLLDISADTCLCGQDFVVLEETDCKVDVIGYNDDQWHVHEGRYNWISHDVGDSIWQHGSIAPSQQRFAL